ncbi:MAG: hypothetical protein PHG16_11820 [Lachnospiraceae bacterium]|nr:hypothetical protein [Lachnospiraceae bacterium]
MKKTKRKRNPFGILIAVLGFAILLTPVGSNRLVVTIILLVGIGVILLAALLHTREISLLPKPKWFSMKVRKYHGQPQRPDVETLLWRQINFQITNKLQSAYPGATWDYLVSPQVDCLLDCQPIRIRINQTGDYNFAEVHMNQYGNLSLVMMTIDALMPRHRQEDGKTEPQVDPESWYSLIGKPLLTEVIGELQARGHQKLFINEQGDIFIQNNDAQEIKGSFEQFPPRSYWPALTDIFLRDELAASETDQALELSWM